MLSFIEVKQCVRGTWIINRCRRYIDVNPRDQPSIGLPFSGSDSHPSLRYTFQVNKSCLVEIAFYMVSPYFKFRIYVGMMPTWRLGQRILEGRNNKVDSIPEFTICISMSTRVSLVGIIQ